MADTKQSESRKRHDADFAVTAKNSPITMVRIPAINIDSQIKSPGIARGNAAVCTDRPDGDIEYTRRFKDYTPLQQHVLFWDRDGDGQIYPWDTYTGFREIGFSILFSILAMLIINLNFSYPTRLAYSYLPDPWFRVYVRSIHKAKHGSDSGTYDPEGRFLPQLFENLFAKWDKDGDEALTFSELFYLMQGHRCVADPFGWGAAFFEWGTTWLLLQKDGKVYKDDLRAVYDGSLFWTIREQYKNGTGWHQGFTPDMNGILQLVQKVF